MISLVNPKIHCFYLHHRIGVGQGATDLLFFVDQDLPSPELCGFGVICNITYYIYSQMCAYCTALSSGMLVEYGDFSVFQRS